MASTSSNNPLTFKNNMNTKIAGTSVYDDTLNIESNVKNNFYNSNIKSKNHFPKKKNILSAIDLNQNYYDRKRPYSTSKTDHLNKHSNKKSNLNKPHSAKVNSKAHDNLDLGNYQDLRSINADYYQALIDKITKEYGEIDADLIHEYISNLKNDDNIQIIDENNNNDEHQVNNNGELINNNENSEMNAKNQYEDLNQGEEICVDNEENFY